MDYDAIIILCFRVGNPKALIVPGAQKTNCGKCGHEVWIALSSLKMKKKHDNARIQCDICTKETAKQEICEVLPLNNDQISEIQDGLWNKKTRN